MATVILGLFFFSLLDDMDLIVWCERPAEPWSSRWAMRNLIIPRISVCGNDHLLFTTVLCVVHLYVDSKITKHSDIAHVTSKMTDYQDRLGGCPTEWFLNDNNNLTNNTYNDFHNSLTIQFWVMLCKNKRMCSSIKVLPHTSVGKQDSCTDAWLAAQPTGRQNFLQSPLASPGEPPTTYPFIRRGRMKTPSRNIHNLHLVVAVQLLQRKYGVVWTGGMTLLSSGTASNSLACFSVVEVKQRMEATLPAL